MPASWELALKTYIPEPAGWQKYLFSLTFLIQKINSVNKKTGLAAFWPILAIIFFNIIDIIKCLKKKMFSRFIRDRENFCE